MKLARNILCGLLILDGVAFIASCVFVIWNKNGDNDIPISIMLTSTIGLLAFGIPFGILQNKIEGK